MEAPPGRPPPPRSFHDPSSIARTSSAAGDSPSFASGGAAAVSHSLSSILNNPSSGRSDASWSLWWPSGSTSSPDLGPPLALPAVAGSGAAATDISRAAFLPYLSSISDSFARFEDVLNHSTKESAAAEIRGQGEALVACLREVPSLFFKEDFALEEGETFRAACPFSPAASENAELQERLTRYLDVSEMHLVKEISLRSDSFFEAQGRLVGLNGEILEACVRIGGLKETIRLLTVDLVDSARQVQELNGARGNLVSLQQKLTVILYVSQALSALKLLVGAADCAGALDVIDDLQHILDTDELAGLHCFRHLREQLAASLDSINNILSAEFLRAAIHDAKAAESVIVSKSKARSSNPVNGTSTEELDEGNSIIQDCLLPLIIGLLRTAKLPAVLRLYRDTIVADMKAAVKMTVAELVPVLVNKSLDSDLVSAERATDAESGGPSLASKLRNLSTESFVELLSAIFKVVEVHLLRAAEVKRLIEWIMGNIEGCFTADSVVTTAVITADNALESDAQTGLHASHPLPRHAPKIPILQGKVNESSSPSTSKNFRADILRENTEAVFAACDTAHGRWAKLLVVRAHIHPKLRLQEFLSISNVTQDFITSTEKIGGRLGYSIRGTLQSQSKAFIDYQHDSRMAKIKAVLDQETWVAVDVPDEFQGIVQLLSSLDTQSNIELEGNLNLLPVELGSSDHSPIMSRSVRSSSNHVGSASTQENESVLPTSRQGGAGNANEHGKSATQTLVLQGVGYHMVNCGLILVKMIAEYVDISRSLTPLASEVVHRIVEILKFFNTRTCQLVLGAGAMQVSGLKSITSKHLALASQIITFICVLIPDIQQAVFLKLPESRKVLLLSEIDRLAQDYKVHRDEIHTKLVQIMRERLLLNVRKLPQIVESWNGPEDGDIEPSQFARSVTKEVTFLHRILSQTLLEKDVQAIFRQVVEIFHSHILEAFSNIDVKTPQARKRLRCDAQLILGCIRKLPSEDSARDGVPNYGLLDEFLEELERKQVT